MITIQLSLVGIALVLTIVSGVWGKVPLWIPLLLVCIALLVPMGVK